MNTNTTFQILIAALTIALLVLLADPLMLYMPQKAAMAALLGTTILLCIWAGLVMNERAGDEREELHRQTAGRVAYLAGIGMLTLALFTQGLSHDIDPWIALALAAMILAKIGTHFYTDRYK